MPPITLETNHTLRDLRFFKGLVRKEKDVLNHRYGYKRAAYLHLLAKELQKDKHFAEVKWTGFR